MSSRFDVKDEPANSRNYSWRSSAELELDALEKLDAAQKSLREREIYGSSRSKSPVAFSGSANLTRSVDLFSSSVGCDFQSNGIQSQYGRPKSAGFDPTENHAYSTSKSFSRAVTPSGNRKSNISSNEFTRSLDLGTFASLPSSTDNHQKSRSKTPVTREGDDRVKSRPPIAPGRPRPQPSDTLPRSGKYTTYGLENSKTTSGRNTSSSNSKRALHSSITSLDGLKYVDKQQLYDNLTKYGTVSTSGTNLDRPNSRNSDLASFSHVQLGSSLGTLGERNSSANTLRSLLSESRPRSALTGSLALQEQSETPVTVTRKFAGTPDFENRDKSSSLRHSTNLELRSSYDDIINRLRKMDTWTSSENLRTKSEAATNPKKMDPESVTRSSAYVLDNAFNKKSTDEYSSKRVSDQFGDTDGMKESLKYGRSSARSKDKFQNEDGRKPRITGKAIEISEEFDSRLDLSNRTGERMSAYSKNGAIERWLRSVTNESSDLPETRVTSDRSAIPDTNFSCQDHQEYSESAKKKKPIKAYESLNGFDDKARNERSRKIISDSYESATPSRKQFLEKRRVVSTDSVYDVNKPSNATGRGYEPDLPLAKQERDRTSHYLSPYDPNARSDSRLSLLRKCLDQADYIGAQSVSSAVDSGYLKLPDGLEMDDLRRSSSSLENRNFKLNTSQLNGSANRKTSSDLSNLGYCSKPVHTATTRTPSTEALSDKDPHSGISLSRSRLEGYQKSSSGLRYEDQPSHSGSSFQNLHGSSINALSSAVERPRSPTRSFGQTFGNIEQDITVQKSEPTGLELDMEIEKARKSSAYTTPSGYHDNTPSYSSFGQDWKSRSYGNSSAGDAGKATKEKHDVSDFQLTGGYEDTRTLLSILEKNKRYKMAPAADQSHMTEPKYSSPTTTELLKLPENADSRLTSTIDAASRYPKDETPVINEVSHGRSFGGFSSLVPPKRVWNSEEHLASSMGDADNDISVKFDYKPNTFRYVLRKDAGESASDRKSASNWIPESSAAAFGVRKWRSDLALFGDNLDNEDPPAATSGGSRHTGLSVLRSSSFRGTTEGRTPERRQVTWQDEVLHKKDSRDSTVVLSDKTTWQDDVLSGKTSAVSPSAMSSTSSIDRVHPVDRNSIAGDSTGLAESRLFYKSLRSQSPSSKSLFTSAWQASGRDENRQPGLKETVTGDSSTNLLQESPSNYRPSYRLTSFTNNDHEPFSTKVSSMTLYDDHNLTSATNPTSEKSESSPEDHSTYIRQTPTEDGVFSKSSTYLPIDSAYKFSYSPTRYTSTAFSSSLNADSDNYTGKFETSNSVRKAEKGQPSSFESGLRSTEILANKSYDKSTDDSYKDSVLRDTWRSLTSNRALSNSIPDSYSHPLSSSVYGGSTRQDSIHLTRTSLTNPSGTELSSTQGFVSSFNLPRSDNATLPLNLTSTSTHDSRHPESNLLSSTDASTKDNSSARLPYKYLSYTNHVASSSNCSNDNTFGQLSTSLSHPYSGIGRHLGLASSRSASRDDLRHLGADSLTNGISGGVDFLSAAADKHDDGMSLVSETEFVVMRSGDIVKRPFKKSDKNDVHDRSRYGQNIGSAYNLFR